MLLDHIMLFKDNLLRWFQIYDGWFGYCFKTIEMQGASFQWVTQIRIIQQKDVKWKKLSTTF